LHIDAMLLYCFVHMQKGHMMISRQDIISGFQPSEVSDTLEGKALNYIKSAGDKGMSQKVLLNRMRGYELWEEIAEATANLVERGRVTAMPMKRTRVDGSNCVLVFVK